MSRRIEIELTSARPDGTWTWRAAGAREPKGVLDGSLLHPDAKPGQVLRAEADFELEGIVITSVTAPKADHRSEPERIEVVGPARPDGPGVTTQLVGRTDRRRDRDETRRRERPAGERPIGRPRREGESTDRQGPGGERRGRRPEPAGADDRPRRDRAGGEGPTRREGPSRHDGPSRPDGTARRSKPTGEGDRRSTDRPSGDRTTTQRRGAPARADAADRSRSRRLNPGSVHRKALMESLPLEQQPIAEQLLRGGVPAVRTALHLEREKALAEGRPAPNADELVALAETLLPRVRAAEWRDRADAVVADVEHTSMRDLRSIVAGADVARDDESRTLLATLRETLERRVAKLHEDWAADIKAQLDGGRVVRAVRLSGRPPEPSARLDPELTQRLTEAAGATLAGDTAPDLWASLLEAVAESPIRRSVTPVALPADAPAELRRAAHQLSGTIPALAKMLGVAIPPPPAPLGARRRIEGGPAGRRPGGRPSGNDRPPAPEPAGGEATTPAAVAATDTGPPTQTSPGDLNPGDTDPGDTDPVDTDPVDTDPVDTDPGDPGSAADDSSGGLAEGS